MALLKYRPYLPDADIQLRALLKAVAAPTELETAQQWNQVFAIMVCRTPIQKPA